MFHGSIHTTLKRCLARPHCRRPQVAGSCFTPPRPKLIAMLALSLPAGFSRSSCRPPASWPARRRRTFWPSATTSMCRRMPASADTPSQRTSASWTRACTWCRVSRRNFVYCAMCCFAARHALNSYCRTCVATASAVATSVHMYPSVDTRLYLMPCNCAPPQAPPAACTT